MNKKILSVFALVLASIMCLSLCACSGGNKAAGIAPGSAFKDAQDMAVVINGVTYPVRVDSKAVLEALGGIDSCEYEETVSCVYKGYDKSFDFGDIRVSTVPVDDVDIIEMFTLRGGDYATPRGIKVGDPRQKMIEAYGESCMMDDGYYVTYTANGDPNDFSAMRIMFKMNGDTIEEICVYSPSYTND